MKTKQQAIQAISTQGLLPLFYEADPQLSLEIIRTLYRAGVRVLEYTNRGTAALDNFRFLKAAMQTEMPDLFLGIGTIKNIKEASDFIAAGADFIVCPVVDPEVGALSHEAGLLWIPGCFSPTEINVAHQQGAGIIKLFPADQLGPQYLAAVKAVFADQLFIPTGGVEIAADNISSWFKAGVCAVGMGSKLITQTMIANKDMESLYQQTLQTLQLINQSRS